MKRISLRLGFPSARIHVWGLLALLAFTPGIVKAYYCSPYSYGVRYSPYALSYHHSGLIRGDVDYSPYAFSYRNSGLLSIYTQYTPYALSYYHSGLVADYGTYPRFCFSFAFPVHGLGHGFRPPRLHRPSTVVRRIAQTPPRPAASGDAMGVIRQHLRAKGFASMTIDRILRVDSQLVSVDVLVKDRNLLIKYWNPQEVQRLNASASSRQAAYAKYKQSWEQYAEKYRQAGGEIYYVNAAEPQAIVAALESCTKLGPGNNTQIQPVLYAKD